MKLIQVDLTLARYTCVALQRLNGSAKKVKGSLLDKSIRLEMHNALFTKLQACIERPCRSKEWFPMAEQAINTVFALAERPDLFCEQLIKNLMRRVFDKKAAAKLAQEERDHDAMDEDNVVPDSGPDNSAAAEDNGKADGDTAEVFHLSQLLFVVGHVAIKQIVFLELVERELKRQKHEREAGTSMIHFRMVCLTRSIQRRRLRAAATAPHEARRTPEKSLIKSQAMLKMK